MISPDLFTLFSTFRTVVDYYIYPKCGNKHLHHKHFKRIHQPDISILTFGHLLYWCESYKSEQKERLFSRSNMESNRLLCACLPVLFLFTSSYGGHVKSGELYHEPWIAIIMLILCYKGMKVKVFP